MRKSNWVHLPKILRGEHSKKTFETIATTPEIDKHDKLINLLFLLLHQFHHSSYLGDKPPVFF